LKFIILFIILISSFNSSFAKSGEILKARSKIVLTDKDLDEYPSYYLDSQIIAIKFIQIQSDQYLISLFNEITDLKSDRRKFSSLMFDHYPDRTNTWVKRRIGRTLYERKLITKLEFRKYLNRIRF